MFLDYFLPPNLKRNRTKIESQVEKKHELHNKHSEFKKKVTDLEEQLELVSKDSCTMENTFDELHQRYVRLKAVHQRLAEGNKILHQRMTELKGWASEDSEATTALHTELHTMQKRWVSVVCPVAYYEDTHMLTACSTCSWLRIAEGGAES